MQKQKQGSEKKIRKRQERLYGSAKIKHMESEKNRVYALGVERKIWIKDLRFVRCVGQRLETCEALKRFVKKEKKLDYAFGAIILLSLGIKSVKITIR